MTAGHALPILIFTLLLGGCSDSRGRAKDALKRVKPEQLRKDVAHYYKDIFAEHRKTIATVNQQYWSGAFMKLSPQRVTAYPDGFAFCLEVMGDTESGLYIVPLGMDVEPKPTPWATFEKLSEGIYWYSFKP